MRVHFSENIFDYQTLRAMAYTAYGGAEPGEVLSTAERIEGGDTDSWYAEWHKLAAHLESAADEANRDGRLRTARGAYFRAHTYYRTAEFFLTQDDPRRIPTYERSRETFRAGLSLLETPVETIEIPYEDTSLPGYRFLPDGDESRGQEPYPTIVCLGGFDSLAEELYFICGVPEALARGYAVCLFEGPGQGAPLRYEGLTARPDWEHVVGPVLDRLEEDESVDPDRLGLVGLSFGGYYAPRAAAFEDRVAACVAFDHMHDLWGVSAYETPRLARVMLRAPDRLINGMASLGSRFSVESRWLMDNSAEVFGVDSAAALQRTLRRYSLSGVAGEIDCPMLVLAGADDHFVPVGLAREFLDELTCPTTYREFSTAEGAGEHCQVGNLSLASAVIYDWFDETLR